MRFAVVVLAALVGGHQAPPRVPPAAQPAEDPLSELTQRYLWPASDADFRAADAALNADPSLKAMTRERFHDLEEAMRRGRPAYQPVPTRADGKFPVAELLVEVPAGPAVPVLVQLPSRYDPRTDWPLMFAMHGGPPGSAAQARSGAERMLRVWADAAEDAGWIVAAPAL